MHNNKNERNLSIYDNITKERIHFPKIIKTIRYTGRRRKCLRSLALKAVEGNSMRYAHKIQIQDGMEEDSRKVTKKDEFR